MRWLALGAASKFVGPQTQLEIDAAFHGGGADELQEVEITRPFNVCQQVRFAAKRRSHGDLHVVAGNIQQKRICEVKIRVANLSDEIVANPEAQIEAIKTMGREHGQIIAPCAAIVVPGLVLHFAHEGAQHAANAVGGLLHDGMGKPECRGGIRFVIEPVGQFEQSIGETARIAARDCQNASAADGRIRNGKGFGRGRRLRGISPAVVWLTDPTIRVENLRA
jgi:hypothetical protein